MMDSGPPPPSVNISDILANKPSGSPTKSSHSGGGGPAGKDDNVTPAQRMAMARRRYSIILPAVAARRSIMDRPKPKGVGVLHLE